MYILASKRNGTLYVGMTDDVAKRIVEHRNGRGSKFVQKYNLGRLVYYEKVNGYREARRRERQLKWWKRRWKIRLIERLNPNWEDLYPKVCVYQE